MFHVSGSRLTVQ